MNFSKIFAALSVFSIMAISASAQTAQSSDRSKIRNGVKSGELTKKETRTLAQQQKEIRKDVKDARADGNVSTRERRRIKKEKMKADASIYRKKHNNRERD